MTTYGRTNAVTAGGGTSTPTQTKEVQATAFPTVVTPDEGYALSQATVTAPENLSAENIKKDVTIAGVTGSFEGASIDNKWFNIMKSRSLTDSQDGTAYTIYESDWDGMTNIPAYICENARISYIEIPAGATLNERCFSKMKPGFKKSGGYNSPLPVEIVFKGSLTIKSGNICSGCALNEFPTSYVGAVGGEIYQSMFYDTIFYGDIFIVPEGITTIKRQGLTIKFVDIDSFNFKEKSGTIVLPTTITNIASLESFLYIWNGSIVALQLKSTTPPTLESGSSSYQPSKIIVPAGCLEAYQTATNWSAFADKMEEATE